MRLSQRDRSVPHPALCDLRLSQSLSPNSPMVGISLESGRKPPRMAAASPLATSLALAASSAVGNRPSYLR